MMRGNAGNVVILRFAQDDKFSVFGVSGILFPKHDAKVD